MKYCSKCGKEIMDEAVICPGCGCAQENNVPGNNAPQIKTALSNLGREASSNFGWSVLGFFILRDIHFNVCCLQFKYYYFINPCIIKCEVSFVRAFCINFDKLLI